MIKVDEFFYLRVCIGPVLDLLGIGVFVFLADTAVDKVHRFLILEDPFVNCF